MATKFNLRSFLAENRDTVISNYESLKNEKFFNGITLRDFMIQVMCSMSDVKSEARAKRFLPHIIGQVYCDNSRIYGNDVKTDALKKAMPNGQWAAII